MELKPKEIEMNTRLCAASLVFVFFVFLSGCAGVGPRGNVVYPTAESSARVANTVVGGALGAAAGAAIGAVTGNPAAGAAIGAVAGGVLGGTSKVHEDSRYYYRYRYVPPPPPAYYYSPPVPEDYWEYRRYSRHYGGGYRYRYQYYVPPPPPAYYYGRPRCPVIPGGRRCQY